MDNNKLTEFMDVMSKAYYNKSIFFLSDFFQSETRIVFLLLKSGGESTPGDISAELGFSTAHTASLLRSLEHKKYIDRLPAAKDRRRVIVTLTDEGKAFADEKYSEIKTFFAKLFDAFGEKDLNEFIRLMGRLSEITEDITKE